MSVDPFTVIIVGGTLGLFVALVLLGLFYPGTGAQQLDWRTSRSPEVEAQNEIDDLQQMLEAANRRRRRRGEPELTEASVRASVGDDLAAMARTRDEDLAELEVTQMLDRKNARRRKKGLPEITADEYREQLRREGRL